MRKILGQVKVFDSYNPEEGGTHLQVIQTLEETIRGDKLEEADMDQIELRKSEAQVEQEDHEQRDDFLYELLI